MHEDIPPRRNMTMNRLLRDQVQECSPRFTRLMINHSNVSFLGRKINSARGFSEINARRNVNLIYDPMEAI